MSFCVFHILYIYVYSIFSVSLVQRIRWQTVSGNAMNFSWNERWVTVSFADLRARYLICYINSQTQSVIQSYIYRFIYILHFSYLFSRCFYVKQYRFFFLRKHTVSGAIGCWRPWSWAPQWKAFYQSWNLNRQPSNHRPTCWVTYHPPWVMPHYDEKDFFFVCITFLQVQMTLKLLKVTFQEEIKKKTENMLFIHPPTAFPGQSFEGAGPSLRQHWTQGSSRPWMGCQEGFEPPTSEVWGYSATHCAGQ